MDLQQEELWGLLPQWVETKKIMEKTGNIRENNKKNMKKYEKPTIMKNAWLLEQNTPKIWFFAILLPYFSV